MRSGTIYLTCAAVGALNTANAYRPFARDGRLSLPAFVTGMLTSELPLHALGWQAAATIGFAARRAFPSATGNLGLALSVASWVGLAGLYRSAQRSRATLESGLQQALGSRYLDRIPGRLREVDELPLTRLQVTLPNRGSRRRYRHTRNLPYGTAGIHHQLDIWRRPDLDVDGAAPVLLQIHGGAWVMGRKDDDAGPLLAHMAERGWVCVSVNYRLSPAATWPDQITDVKRAIAWVRENIAAHGGDPSFLAVTGGSAGGHLSALAALTANDGAFQEGFEQSDTSVQAAVPFYGLFDLTNRSGGTRSDTMSFLAEKVFKSERTEDLARWEAGSPLCRISAEAPPFLIIHGTNDSFLPVEQARAFAAELGQVAVAPVAFVELPRTQHGFDFFSSVRVHHTVRAVERFLAYVYESRRESHIKQRAV
jgi:acetyl esterase/lipase